MGFFGKIKSSFGIISETFKSIKKYPILLLPIFITWIMIAFLVVYITYYFEFPETPWLVYLICFLIFWFVTFVLSFTSGIMVEIVKQIETDGNLSFGNAFNNNFTNIGKIAGIALIWAFLWFILVIIEALLSKSKKNNSRTINYQGVARTLGGDSSFFSWFGLGLDVLKDVIRMAVFLSIPAMLWKNKGVFSGIKEGAKVIGKHPVEFLGVYGSIFLIGVLMAIPLGIIFALGDSGKEFSDIFWIGVIIYEGIIWTFSIYMEQMTSTLLFLWHMKWENQKINPGEELKHISEIAKPSLVDDILEFNTEEIV